MLKPKGGVEMNNRMVNEKQLKMLIRVKLVCLAIITIIIVAAAIF